MELKTSLAKYDKDSGQMMSWAKLSVVFTPNVNIENRNALCNILLTLRIEMLYVTSWE